MNRFAVLVPLFLAGGCTSPGSGYPAPPANTYVQQVVYGVNDVPATTTGYILSASSSQVLRVTWGTTSGTSQFQGSIFAAGFGELTPGCDDGSCPISPGDVVQLTDSGMTDGMGRIDFVSSPQPGKHAGFDVEVQGSENTFVDLLINGERQPEQVAFTTVDTSGQPAATTASTMPVGLQIVPQPSTPTD